MGGVSVERFVASLLIKSRYVTAIEQMDENWNSG